jgi:hypothetical protein
MGKKAVKARRSMRRSIRSTPLSEVERAHLSANATYEGSPFHKRNPGDFGLTPPAAPRPDKTLCDEAAVFEKAAAKLLLAKAIAGGVVSDGVGSPGFPKELWVVDDYGRVFEAIYGGSKVGAYHGYPVRENEPFFHELVQQWNERHG